MRVGNRIATAAAVGVALLVVGLVVSDRVRRQTARDFLNAGRSHAPVWVEHTGDLDRRIDESSGVAVSRAQPGVLWTHNDSGDDAWVYAIDLTGRRIARFEVQGAVARDWEDIALGPCPGGSPPGSCLYIADTGNNQRMRDRLHIYVIVEPTIDSTAGRKGTVDLLADVPFVYPDQRHDAEALGVAPNGDLIVVNKGRSGAIAVYRLPAHQVGPTAEPVVLEKLVTLPIVPRRSLGRQVTGGAVSPSGATLVIRTYTEIFFLDWPPDSVPVLNDRRCYVGDLARGGEAIDFFDDSTLVVTSERSRGVPGPIHLLRCP